jgi:hypothetical protein
LIASKPFVSSLHTFIGGPPGVDWRTDVPAPKEVNETIPQQEDAFAEFGSESDLGHSVPYGVAMIEPLLGLVTGKSDPEEVAEELQALSDRARDEQGS